MLTIPCDVTRATDREASASGLAVMATGARARFVRTMRKAITAVHVLVGIRAGVLLLDVLSQKLRGIELLLTVNAERLGHDFLNPTLASRSRLA